VKVKGDPSERTRRALIRTKKVMAKMGVEWKVGASEQVTRLVKGEQTLLEYWMFARDGLWHWVMKVYDHVCESNARRNPKSG